MACKKGTKKSHLKAILVTKNKLPCVFCQRKVDEEITYGKLYAIGDIQCHYFCVLLSCCTMQRGNDEDGLFGFLYPDILAEVERSKKHKCSYCGKGGATLGCCVTQCRKQFHLPCGRERHAVSLFYGNYKSFCAMHAPKQKIPDHIMAHAKIRLKKANALQKAKKSKKSAKLYDRKAENITENSETQQDSEMVCVICYEAVDGFPTLHTFWPPCCARDAWFHRSCVERMALSAGMHYLKCPLCNDKENFYEAVVSQGYYVPDRDAAWELEQGAFSEMYERPLSCGAGECRCPLGREHDAETGMWDIKLCMLCGASGAHAHCLPTAAGRYVCQVCEPHAPDDLDALAVTVEAVILSEQNQPTAPTRRGPIMPSRMSLRRTKLRALRNASTSQCNKTEPKLGEPKDTTSSREDLNLKPPRKPPRTNPEPLSSIENHLLSPTKLLEERLAQKMMQHGADVDRRVVEQLRRKFNKPRPLCAKKRIIEDILEDLFNNFLTVKNRSTPKKCTITNLDEQFENIFTHIKEETKAIEMTASSENMSKETVIDITENFEETASIETKGKPFEIFENASKETEEEKSTIIEEIGATETKADLEENTSNKTKEEPSLIVDDDTQDIVGDSFSDQLKQNKEESRVAGNCITNTELPCNNIEAVEGTLDDDASSTSTFQLPPEFIADCPSDESLSEAPKRLKTIEMKDSSLEISENDEVVNIDVVKIEAPTDNKEFVKIFDTPSKSNKCWFKFSPLDKETLDKNDVDMDIENFKDQYLNELDLKPKINGLSEEGTSSQSAEQDDAVDGKEDLIKEILKLDKNDVPDNSTKSILTHSKSEKNLRKRISNKEVNAKHKRRNLKRKLTSKDDGSSKRKKCERLNIKKDVNKGELKGSNKKNCELITSLDVAVETGNMTSVKRKKSNKKSRRSVEFPIKIRLKFESKSVTDKKKIKLKFKSKTVTDKNKHVLKFKQYILNDFSAEMSSKNFLLKPKTDVETPKKRKSIKLEKSPDGYVQTSINSFFKKMNS